MYNAEVHVLQNECLSAIAYRLLEVRLVALFEVVSGLFLGLAHLLLLFSLLRLLLLLFLGLPGEVENDCSVVVVLKLSVSALAVRALQTSLELKAFELR